MLLKNIMPLPTSKIELLSKLKQSYEKLDEELCSIHSTDERIDGIEGNISCCDILSYQIGWGRLLLDWEYTEISGGIAQMPAANYKWNQLSKLAESFYQGHSKKSLQQLRTEYAKLYQDLCALITTLSDKELFQPLQRQWTGNKWAMVKWIQVNTIAPYQSARTKVRRWKRESSS